MKHKNKFIKIIEQKQETDTQIEKSKETKVKFCKKIQYETKQQVKSHSFIA